MRESANCPVTPSRERSGQLACEFELQEPLAAGVVEVQQVAIGRPDGSESNAAWSLQRELQSARLALADQSRFGHCKLIGEKIFPVAQRFVNKGAESIESADPASAFGHGHLSEVADDVGGGQSGGNRTAFVT